MPRREMLRRMDAQELNEWMAYEQIEPFGEERADLRSGISTAAIVNTLRQAFFRDAPTQEVVDLMPFTERPERDPRADALAVAAALGWPGRDVEPS